MKSTIKLLLIIFSLSITMYLSFAFSKAKYVGTDFISQLAIPYTFSAWQGRDVTESLNINSANTNYNFINDALAHQYVNNKGDSVLFIVLDAGNFHHPKVCFTGSGYKIKELPDTRFNLSHQSFRAHTLFTTRGNRSFLSLYWIVIDKKVAHEWIEQKFKQLYFSMFNKKRVGLMVRLDIPAEEKNIEEKIILAKEFIKDLSHILKPEQADHIFGISN